MSFQLIRNANVSVEAGRNHKGQQIATAYIGDHHEHQFTPTSRISQALDTTTPQQIAERMSGGQYFFTEEGELHDFRYGDYDGFVHEDGNIDKLAELIGFSPKSESRARDNATGNTISLRHVWNDAKIVIPQYAEGGQFKSRFSYAWSPFNKNVTGSFELVRLICANGMMGLTSFLNTKVPIVNRWEEHLDIASIQIQNKIESMMGIRLNIMAEHRASVGELMLISQHAMDRLSDSYITDPDMRERLRVLAQVASPVSV